MPNAITGQRVQAATQELIVDGVDVDFVNNGVPTNGEIPNA
ncbi:hypothetical protein EGR_10217 [Echinococcus granulosus]|uniref:Uncharacterized protein n=1 Tax=Echinococcus granulosus TaxID=6210 RepID=W6U1I6_ECHGR|nr:hypothetical protein EGR_10217 [Echinococcus granulosus]EUB54935.1 hypothetical protein EGR_10217 [Echinococcus granulosus]